MMSYEDFFFCENLVFDLIRQSLEVVVKDIAIGARGHWLDSRAGQIGHSYPVHISNLCGLVVVGFLHHN